MTLLAETRRFTMRTRRRKTARARGTFPFNPAGFPFNLPPPSSSRHLSRQKYVNPPFINPYINPRHKGKGRGRDESGRNERQTRIWHLPWRTKEEKPSIPPPPPPSSDFLSIASIVEDKNPSVERIPYPFLGCVTFSPRSKTLAFVWDSPTP